MSILFCLIFTVAGFAIGMVIMYAIKRPALERLKNAETLVKNQKTDLRNQLRLTMVFQKTAKSDLGVKSVYLSEDILQLFSETWLIKHTVEKPKCVVISYRIWGVENYD